MAGDDQTAVDVSNVKIASGDVSFTQVHVGYGA